MLVNSISYMLFPFFCSKTAFLFSYSMEHIHKVFLYLLHMFVGCWLLVVGCWLLVVLIVVAPLLLFGPVLT